MKKKRYTCEQLSEIYDEICGKKIDVEEVFPDLCEKSIKEFRELEGAISIFQGLKGVEIKDLDQFCSETLELCTRERPFFLFDKIYHQKFRRYAIPAAAAVAVFVAVVSVAVFSPTAPKPDADITIASGVDQNQNQYIIKSKYIEGREDVIPVVMEHNGLILSEEEGVIKVRARLSDFGMIQKELTLSAEDKVFYNQHKNIITAGSNSNVYTSHYVDEIITFEIVVDGNSK